MTRTTTRTTPHDTTNDARTAFGEPAPSPATGGDATKRRLLDAAELLFAEQGFADTSVRDITSAAECNLASVNYHFGGKERLYVEVFKRSLKDLRQYRMSRIEAAMKENTATLDSVLMAFSTSFLEPLVDSSRGRLLMLLYQREMSQPMLPTGMFFTELIDPLTRLMQAAWEKTCPGLTDAQQRMCLNSLVGQLMYVVQTGRMFEMAGRDDAPVLDRRAMLEHIVNFTVAGMRQYQNGTNNADHADHADHAGNTDDADHTGNADE